MPFKSKSQERWAHTAEGRAALGDKLPEFDAASKGLNLPERIGPKGPVTAGQKIGEKLKERNYRLRAGLTRKFGRA
jgi:hypothetical protein